MVLLDNKNDDITLNRYNFSTDTGRDNLSGSLVAMGFEHYQKPSRLVEMICYQPINKSRLNASNIRTVKNYTLYRPTKYTSNFHRSME